MSLPLATSKNTVFSSAKFATPTVRFARPHARFAKSQMPLKRSVMVMATNSKVLEDVRGIIAQQFAMEVSKVTPDAKFADLGADSLDTVEIMMALEEKFSLHFDEDSASKIHTVQEAADFISSNLPE